MEKQLLLFSFHIKANRNLLSLSSWEIGGIMCEKGRLFYLLLVCTSLFFPGGNKVSIHQHSLLQESPRFFCQCMRRVSKAKTLASPAKWQVLWLKQKRKSLSNLLLLFCNLRSARLSSKLFFWGKKQRNRLLHFLPSLWKGHTTKLP